MIKDYLTYIIILTTLSMSKSLTIFKDFRGDVIIDTFPKFLPFVTSLILVEENVIVYITENMICCSKLPLFSNLLAHFDITVYLLPDLLLGNRCTPDLFVSCGLSSNKQSSWLVLHGLIPVDIIVTVGFHLVTYLGHMPSRLFHFQLQPCVPACMYPILQSGCG